MNTTEATEFASHPSFSLPTEKTDLVDQNFKNLRQSGS